MHKTCIKNTTNTEHKKNNTNINITIPGALEMTRGWPGAFEWPPGGSGAPPGVAPRPVRGDARGPAPGVEHPGHAAPPF